MLHGVTFWIFTPSHFMGMTNYRIRTHRTTSHHVCKRDCNFKSEAKKALEGRTNHLARS